MHGNTEKTGNKNKRTHRITAAVLLIIVTSVFPKNARAELFEPPGSLKALVETVLSENEGIRQLEAELEALQAEVPAARTLDDPRITLGIAALPTDTFSFSQEPMTQKQVVVSQRLPWFGKLDLRAQRVVWAAARKTEMLRARKSALRREVSEVYFDLLYVQRALEVNRELNRMVERILRVAESNYAGGKGPQQDIFQAQVEIGMLLEESENLRARKRSLQDRLHALMNREMFMEIAVPEDPEMPVPASIPAKEALVEQVLAENPGMAALKADIELSGVDIQLAEKDYRPDVDIAVGYGQREEDAAGRGLTDFVSGTVSFNIPLWSKNKQDKKLFAAQKRKEAAKRAYQDLRKRIPFQVDALVREMEGIQENHRLLQEAVILQSDQWARAALSAYAVGEVNFDTLINAHIRKLRLMLQSDRYRSSAYKVLARLEELIGDLK